MCEHKGTAILAQFQNGRLTASDATAVRKEATLPSGKKKIVYEMAGNGEMSFNYLGEPCASAPGEWMVVIRDKNTGELTMFDAEPVMFRPNTSTFGAPVKDETTPAKSSWFEQKADLSMSFGSKKQQSAIRARKRNAATTIADLVLPDASGSEAGEENADGSPAKVKKEEPGTSGVAPPESVMPTVNYEAKSAAEVYNMEEVLPAERMAAMAEDVDEFVAKSLQQLKEEDYPAVCRLSSQRVPTEPAERLKFVAQLLYLNSLLRLLRDDNKFTMVSLRGFTDYKLTKSVYNWIWESFFVSKGGKISKMRGLPKKNRDRMIVHSILLMLNANNFAFPLSSMSTELKMEEKKLMAFFKMLGCTVVKERGSDPVKMVTLKGPPSKASLASPRKFGKRR